MRFSGGQVLPSPDIRTCVVRNPLYWLRVPYFLFSGVIAPDQSFEIKGEEARHLLASRRIQIGEMIQIQDCRVKRFQARVDHLGKRSLILFPLHRIRTPPASPLHIHLWQALVKEKALDLVIQKSTELGVASLCFFQSRYSQRLLTSTGMDRKLQRWRKIAIEACKQSGRALPPDISFSSELPKFNQDSRKSSIASMPHICLTSSTDAVPFSSVCIESQAVVLIVGPEGGWGEGEIKGAKVQPVCLGPRIMRSETAAIVAVSILQYVHGDLDHPLLPESLR